MEYKKIIGELQDLLDRMERTQSNEEGDDWWIYHTERKALVHAIAIINDLIDERE